MTVCAPHFASERCSPTANPHYRNDKTRLRPGFFVGQGEQSKKSREWTVRVVDRTAGSTKKSLSNLASASKKAGRLMSCLTEDKGWRVSAAKSAYHRIRRSNGLPFS